MRCPCCGASNFQPLGFLDGLKAQIWKIITLVAAISAAIIGQSHLLGEPWMHYVSVAGTVCGAAVAWKIKEHPMKEVV